MEYTFVMYLVLGLVLDVRGRACDGAQSLTIPFGYLWVTGPGCSSQTAGSVTSLSNLEEGMCDTQLALFICLSL